MVQISKRKISDELFSKLFLLFFQIVGKKDNSDDFRQVVNDLFSPVERIMIAKRVAIIYLLLKQIDKATICTVLKVSSSTVAKYAILIEKSEGIVPQFKKILKSEKIRIFLEDIINSFFAPGAYGVNWKRAWKRKIVSEKRKQLGI